MQPSSFAEKDHNQSNSILHINHNFYHQESISKSQLYQTNNKFFKTMQCKKLDFCTDNILKPYDQINQKLLQNNSFRSPIIEQFYNQINAKFKGLFFEKKIALKRKSLQLLKKDEEGKEFKTIIKELDTFKSDYQKSALIMRKDRIHKLINYQFNESKQQYKLIKKKVNNKLIKSQKNTNNNEELLTITQVTPSIQRTIDPEQLEKYQIFQGRNLFQHSKTVSIKQSDYSNKLRKTKIFSAKYQQQYKSIQKSLTSLTTREQQVNTEIIPKNIQFAYLLRHINFNENSLKNIENKDKKYGQAFTILHHKKNITAIITNHNSKKRLEIASLTKIMTCLLILLISQKFNINLMQEKVKVSRKAAQLKGTSAKLNYADYLTINDLLYGLMLPSGNDAAIVLGEWGGKIINNQCFKKTDNLSNLSPRKTNLKNTELNKKKTNISLFVYHMNKLAKQMKLGNTNFVNVHGLMNRKNYSCAQDMAMLSFIAMQRQDFRTIVNTRIYKCNIQNQKNGSEKEQIWENTNKLLKIQNFCGIKTGITPSAGPCLSSYYKISNQEYIIIILLKTMSANHRFEQSKKLLEESLKQLYICTKNKLYTTHLKYLESKQHELDIETQAQDLNNFELNDEQDEQQL